VILKAEWIEQCEEEEEEEEEEEVSRSVSLLTCTGWT
jgi:hypothetical protein